MASSALNAYLVPIKAALEEAEAKLTAREFATLRAILLIAISAKDKAEV